MILPYLGRLACLCLAAFFLAHTALAVLVSLAARGAIRRAAYLRPHVAALIRRPGHILDVDVDRSRCRERQAPVARIAHLDQELHAATPEHSADANSIAGAQPPGSARPLDGSLPPKTCPSWQRASIRWRSCELLARISAVLRRYYPNPTA